MVEIPGAGTSGRCYDREYIESPVYSRDKHESAGIFGCGIQQATRLMRVFPIVARR